MAELNVPKTPIFSAPDKQLQVSGTGVEQLGRAAARVGEQGQQVERFDAQAGEALDRGLTGVGKALDQVGATVKQQETITDLNNINTAHASTLLDLTQKQQQFFADPANKNNPQAAQQFQDNVVQPAMDALNNEAQTPGGQKHAADLTDVLEAHFAQTSAAAYAKSADVQTRASLSYIKNALTSATYAQPANIPAALASYDTMLNGYATNHPEINSDQFAQERLTDRREIIANGLTKYIQDTAKEGGTPNLDPYFKQYGSTLGGDAQEKLSAYADHQVKAYQEQQKANVSANDKALAGDARTAANQLTASLMPVDASGVATGGPLTVPKNFYQSLTELQAKYGRVLPEGYLRSTYELAQKVQNEGPNDKGQHDDTMWTQLSQEAVNGTNSTDEKIMDLNTARVQNRVTDKEYTTLRNTVLDQDKLDPFAKEAQRSAQASAAAYLNQDSSADGAEKLRNFNNWAFPAYNSLLIAGKTPYEAQKEVWTRQNMDTHGVLDAAQPTQSAPVEAKPSTSSSAWGGLFQQAITGLGSVINKAGQ